MSAFIVSEGTMQRAVAAIAVIEGTQSVVQCDQLGRELYKMNYDAIHQRYPDTKESGEYPGPVPAPKPKDFKFRLTQYNQDTYGTEALAPLYKALTCLIYQYSEGNAPETAMYKRLSGVADELAGRIVSDLPAYRNAPWDSDDTGPVPLDQVAQLGTIDETRPGPETEDESPFS